MKKKPIDSRKVDPHFKFLIAEQEGGEGILRCFACGSCTVRCPEEKINPAYNARVIIRKALLGLKEEVYQNEFLWICSAHYLCLSNCPQNINIKGVMNAVRNVKIKEETLGKENEKDSLVKDFKYEIVNQESGKDIFHCFSCGTCTAGCPERPLDSLYSPRKVIRKILLGKKEEVIDNAFIEICSSHYRCLSQCPQDVEIPKLMTAIRRLAEKEGYTREGKKVEKTVPEEKAGKKSKKELYSRPRVFIRKAGRKQMPEEKEAQLSNGKKEEKQGGGVNETE